MSLTGLPAKKDHVDTKKTSCSNMLYKVKKGGRFPPPPSPPLPWESPNPRGKYACGIGNIGIS